MEFLENIVAFLGGMFGDIANMFLGWFSGFFNSIFSTIAEFIGGILIAAGLNLEIPDSVYFVLQDFFYGVGYILPIDELLPIPAVMFTFYTLKFTFAIFRMISGHVINIKPKK